MNSSTCTNYTEMQWHILSSIKPERNALVADHSETYSSIWMQQAEVLFRFSESKDGEAISTLKNVVYTNVSRNYSCEVTASTHRRIQMHILAICSPFHFLQPRCGGHGEAEEDRGRFLTA